MSSGGPTFDLYHGKKKYKKICQAFSSLSTLIIGYDVSWICALKMEYLKLKALINFITNILP